jgi:hypothetical protein
MMKHQCCQEQQRVHLIQHEQVKVMTEMTQELMESLESMESLGWMESLGLMESVV